MLQNPMLLESTKCPRNKSVTICGDRGEISSPFATIETTERFDIPLFYMAGSRVLVIIYDYTDNLY